MRHEGSCAWLLPPLLGRGGGRLGERAAPNVFSLHALEHRLAIGADADDGIVGETPLMVKGLRPIWVVDGDQSFRLLFARWPASPRRSARGRPREGRARRQRRFARRSASERWTVRARRGARGLTDEVRLRPWKP